MVLPPQLTQEERKAALRRAALARKKRSEFKAEIRSGQRRWTDALNSTDPDIRKMRVKELIGSVPGFGTTRTIAVMEKSTISLTRRVQGVGANQLRLLLKCMKESGLGN